MSKEKAMDIEQIRDAVVQAELDYILGLSSKNFYHYVKDVIISRQTDLEVKELYYDTLAEVQDDE